MPKRENDMEEANSSIMVIAVGLVIHAIAITTFVCCLVRRKRNSMNSLSKTKVKILATEDDKEREDSGP